MKRVPRAVVLAAAALVLLPGCAYLRQFLSDVLKEPSLHFQRADLRDLSFTGAGLDLTWRVDNPNEFGVELSSIGYALKLDGNQLTSGNADRGLKIAPAGSSEVTLPFDVRFQDAANALLSLYQKEDVGWQVAGHFGFQTPAGVVKIPYDRNGHLPVPRLPAIELGGARVSRLTLTGADLEVELKLHNRNRFPLPLEALSYGVSVQGQKVGHGDARPADLPANGTRTVKLPVRLDFTRAGRAVYDGLRSGRINLAVDGSLKAGPVSVPVSVDRQVNLK